MLTIILITLMIATILTGKHYVAKAIAPKEQPKEIGYDTHKTKMLEIENMGRDWWEILGTKCECDKCKLDEAWLKYKANPQWSLDEKLDYFYNHILDYDGVMLTNTFYVPAQARDEWNQLTKLSNERNQAQKAKAERERIEKLKLETKHRVEEVLEYKNGVSFIRPASIPKYASASVVDEHSNYPRVFFTWIDPSTGQRMGVHIIGQRAGRSEITYSKYVPNSTLKGTTYYVNSDAYEEYYQRRKYEENVKKLHPPKREAPTDGCPGWGSIACGKCDKCLGKKPVERKPSGIKLKTPRTTSTGPR